MHHPLAATVAAAALALLATTTTADAAQIRYELQGVFDSSPTPAALVGGFTFDTGSSSFSDITVRFASSPVAGTATGTFNLNATLYHYATDQFTAFDSFNNAVVLNYGSDFSHPGTYALTQTGPNSISYVYLAALSGTALDAYTYDVVNGQLAAVPEPGTWALLAAGLLGLARRARQHRAG